jgi:hypothetical protein
VTSRGPLIDAIVRLSGFAPWQVVILLGILLVGTVLLIRGRR